MITGTYNELRLLYKLVKILSDLLIPDDEGKPNKSEVTCFIELGILKEAREFYIDNFTKKL